MSSARDYRRLEADSPYALAYRMAGYIKDAAYISKYVGLEYGKRRAPSVKQVEAMQAAHRRDKETFRLEAEKPKGYNPDNDNGEPYRVPTLIKPEMDPAKREAVLARKRELSAAKREAKKKARQERAASVARRIIRRTADWFGLNEEDLRSATRKAYIVNARWVAIRLMREDERGLTLEQIAKSVGRLDHTTTTNAFECFDDRARKYPAMIAAYEALRHG